MSDETDEVFRALDRAEDALDKAATAIVERSGRTVHLHDLCRNCGQPLRLQVLRLSGICSLSCEEQLSAAAQTNGPSAELEGLNGGATVAP